MVGIKCIVEGRSKQNLTRQPVGGRTNNGGGRIGEMERDSILRMVCLNF